MSIYTFFVDSTIKTIYPDIIRIRSKRAKANAVLLYSEQFKQMIYIKESHRKRPIEKNLMLQYLKRGNDDMLRKMQNVYGKKRGHKLFITADKLNVIVADNVCNSAYRYLWALNINKSNHKKIHFMVFDSKKVKDKRIAATIFGALYTKMRLHIESVEKGLKGKSSYGHVEKKLNDMKSTSNALQKNYYRLFGD